MPNPFLSRAPALSSIAIVASFVCLVLASARLVEVGQNLKSDIGENIVWLASQAQYEGIRLSDTISRYTGGDLDVGKNEIELRLDVFLSRLEAVRDGQPRAYLADLGYTSKLDAQAEALAALEAHIRALGRYDKNTDAAVRSIIQPLVSVLRDAANKSMLIERDRTMQLRDAHLNALLQVFAYIAGVILSCGILTLFLLRGQRKIALATVSLQKERELSQLYREFVSMVSHQFRTPLTVIDMTAQRIMRRGARMSQEEIGERTATIRDAAAQLTKLMESTLNAARFDQGEIAFQPVACNLAELVTDVSTRYTSLEPGRAIDVSCEALPSAAQCDPILMEQVISNLLSNALKYSGRDTPVQVRGWMQEDWIFIAVQDYGIGVPEEDMPRLFDRYFRARTARGTIGTGVGLAFAREIVHMHRGTIEVASREGSGTTFTIRLPRSCTRECSQEAHTVSVIAVG
jgi:signal transduction histidine kinase